MMEPAKAFRDYLEEKEIITPQDVYTISSFLGKRRDKCVMEAGEKLVIRLTTLDRELFGALNAYFFRNRILKQKLQLEKLSFEVVDIRVQQGSSPYIHHWEQEGLLNQLPTSYKIKLLSPTYFKIGEKYKADINSILLFKNLAAKYKKCLGYTVEKEILQQLYRLELKKIEEQSKSVKIDTDYILALQGTYTLDVANISIEVRQWIEKLLTFGTYIGIGYQTSIGYGANQIEKEFNHI